MRRWGKVLLWVALIIAGLFGVILLVLGNVGGNGDFYRQTIERMAADMTGYDAHVQTLNNMRFFPTIIFDFEGLTLENTAGENVATIGAFRSAVSYWDAVFETGRIRDVMIRDVAVAPGAFGSGPGFTVEVLRILPEDEALQARGVYKAMPFDISVPLARSGSMYKPGFSLAETGPVALNLADISLQAEIRRLQEPGVMAAQFEDAVIGLKDEPVLKGAFSLRYISADRRLGLQGDLQAAGGGSRVRPDLQIDLSGGDPLLAGAVEIDQHDPADFAPGSDYAALTERLQFLLSDLMSDVRAATSQAQSAE